MSVKKGGFILLEHEVYDVGSNMILSCNLQAGLPVGFIEAVTTRVMFSVKVSVADRHTVTVPLFSITV